MGLKYIANMFKNTPACVGALDDLPHAELEEEVSEVIAEEEISEEVAEEEVIYDEEIIRKIEENQVEEEKEKETEELVSEPSSSPSTPSVEEVRKDDGVSYSKVSISSPKHTLKELPSNLKYAFIDDSEYFPIIVNSKLDCVKCSKLLDVLSKNKEAIG